MQDRLLREKGEAAQDTRLVLGEIHRADRRLPLERRLHLEEHALLLDVGVGPLLLDLRLEALEPALQDFEVGQDQLGLEVADIAPGIRGGARRVGKRAHDVEERVRTPELLGVEALAVALRDAREVDDLERGGGDLLRLEQRAQAVHPLVRYPREPRVHLRARPLER